MAHGQGPLPAGDHGRHRRPAHPKSGDYERGADREDGRLHPEPAGVLHGLRTGPHPGHAADAGHGADLQQGPAGPHDPGHAGAAEQGGREEPVQREHHHEEELPGRTHHHRGREQRHGTGQPPHQGTAGGRGGPLPGQRRDRGRPVEPSAEAADHLLGQEDGDRLHAGAEGTEPDRDGVQPEHAGGVERALPRVRALPATGVGQRGL